MSPAYDESNDDGPSVQDNQSHLNLPDVLIIALPFTCLMLKSAHVSWTFQSRGVRIGGRGQGSIMAYFKPGDTLRVRRGESKTANRLRQFNTMLFTMWYGTVIKFD
jgi:hypothetical protein